MSFFIGCMGLTLYAAPHIDSPLLRYSCAGAAATMACEVVMHSVDTINMRSKLINGHKVYILELLRLEGMQSLFRGIQPVLYGYQISSIIYFYAYAQSKKLVKEQFYDDTLDTKESNNENTKENNEQLSQSDKDQAKKLFWKTMFIAFFSSAVAENVCLLFYYPFDLIKTRMQVNNVNHQYHGTMDAAFKIYGENQNN